MDSSWDAWGSNDSYNFSVIHIIYKLQGYEGVRWKLQSFLK